MKYVVIVARILLGLPFLVLGLNYFRPLFDVPPLAEQPAAAFMGALMNTGYMLPFIKGTEVVCGALLVLGFFVPLALVVLAPVLLNILAFHYFLSQPGLPVPLALVALELFLVWQYRGHFIGFFNPLPRSVAARRHDLR